MRVVDEGLDQLKQKYKQLSKMSKWKSNAPVWSKRLDQISEERDELVAKYEGRLDEYRRDKERRAGGFDSLETIDSKPAGRSGKLTTEEQMKMAEIRKREEQQNEVLDQINDNLEHLDWQALKLKDAIDDSLDIVQTVNDKAQKVDGKVQSIRDDVQEANSSYKKKKKKKPGDATITKAKMAAHAAGALIS